MGTFSESPIRSLSRRRALGMAQPCNEDEDQQKSRCTAPCINVGHGIPLFCHGLM
jgi:hypothetical protein